VVQVPQTILAIFCECNFFLTLKGYITPTENVIIKFPVSLNFYNSILVFYDGVKLLPGVQAFAYLFQDWLRHLLKSVVQHPVPAGNANDVYHDLPFLDGTFHGVVKVNVFELGTTMVLPCLQTVPGKVFAFGPRCHLPHRTRARYSLIPRL
jgi:hypothetical protein